MGWGGGEDWSKPKTFFERNMWIFSGTLHTNFKCLLSYAKTNTLFSEST